MGGSFHVAPGKSFSINHIHIHDVHPYSSSSFNLSHTIRHLSFGKRINFANTHPLDGMEVIAAEGNYYSLFLSIRLLYLRMLFTHRERVIRKLNTCQFFVFFLFFNSNDLK